MMLIRKEPGQMIEKNIQVCLGKQVLTAFADGSFIFTSAGTEWNFTGGNIQTESQTISFAEMNDIRMEDVSIIGELHDLTFGQLASAFAHDDKDLKRLEDIYKKAN